MRAFLQFLACCRAVLAQLVTFPGTLEVDLIFPRNVTYSPAQFFPFIFAIQNPLLAIPLDLSIRYALFSFGTTDGSNASNISIDGDIDLQNDKISSWDPYLAYPAFDFTTKLSITQGTWLLTWTASSGNCSANPESGRTDQSYLNRDAHVWFTTKKGALPVDLVAATDAGTCPVNTSNLTYNITGTLDTPDPSKFDGRDSCAILSSPPAANPCGAKIAVTAASSISAAITASHCAFPHPLVKCPPAGNAAGSRTLKRLVLLAITLGWGACLLLR
ncbi:hypothetical protein B0T16DRAFT_3144 [Cercophora newfieldiana]|uniref:DUF7136 domain-containing protein n=1 Tax=Cercophora newfieldiana TaxID=92897 RepID=A0AA40CYB7_9PEZI|nr:hypothetical protein B0T16DRAFT_3144 [Cercophora newfieldiana]